MVVTQFPHSEVWRIVSFPLNPIANASCNIECCGNKVRQIVCKYDFVIRFNTETKSAVKDNYIRWAAFLLDMGEKDSKLLDPCSDWNIMGAGV